MALYDHHSYMIYPRIKCSLRKAQPPVGRYDSHGATETRDDSSSDATRFWALQSLLASASLALSALKALEWKSPFEAITGRKPDHRER